MKRALLACLALPLALPALAEERSFATGNLASPRIVLPQGNVRAEFFLISDASGWGGAEDELANRLSGEGAIVVGIDLPAYLGGLEAEQRKCGYTVSAIESLSKQIQRELGVKAYRAPIIAGVGAGGAMALAIAAQTPAATIGETLALDPQDRIALAKPLCTPASKEPVEGGMRYGLTPGALPNAVSVLFSDMAPDMGRAHVQKLQADHPEIAIAASPKSGLAGLEAALTSRLAPSQEQIDDLPLAITEVKPQRDTLAIIVSGDGGWRDIDKKIAGFLQDYGVPSVGIDSLRYFWSEQTPESTARDLERIVDHYTRQFGTKNVALIGYSFGANILPSSFNRMSERHRGQVRMISLLAPSREADFQISVMGWLGAKGAGKAGDPVEDAKRIDARLLHCVYGAAEEVSGCPALASHGAEILAISGGHHFDGDYKSLTAKIVAELEKRLP